MDISRTGFAADRPNAWNGTPTGRYFAWGS
jgi:hypothetical protein